MGYTAWDTGQTEVVVIRYENIQPEKDTQQILLPETKWRTI